MTIEDEVAKATADLQEALDKARAGEKSFVEKVKPHLVMISFIFGALLGFIAGHVLK